MTHPDAPTRLKRGDVFTAPSLARAAHPVAHREAPESRPGCGVMETHIDRRWIEPGAARAVGVTVTETLPGGWTRRVPVTLDTRADDPSRGTAEFVVLDARMGGGGPSYDGGYPDGWHVDAQRLAPGGTQDPDGERVRFYQTGCFTNMLADATLVRRLPFVLIPADP